jgi:hypothetical protein
MVGICPFSRSYLYSEALRAGGMAYGTFTSAFYAWLNLLQRRPESAFLQRLRQIYWKFDGVAVDF